MNPSIVSLFVMALLALCFLKNTQKKGRVAVPSNFLLLYFFGSFLAAFLLSLLRPESLPFVPTIIILSGFGLIIWPVVAVDDSRVTLLSGKRGGICHTPLFKVACLVLSIMGVYSFFYYATFIPTVFQGNIAANRTALEVKGEFLTGGITGKLGSIFSAFYLLSMVLFFHRVCVAKKMDLIALALFAGSIAEVFHVFSMFGRDGVVFWSLSFILNCLLYFRVMGAKLRKRLTTLCLLFVSIFVVGFAAITVSRFTGGRGMTVGESVVAYFGQHIYNYPDVYHFSGQYRTNGYISFPLYLGLVDKKASEKHQIYNKDLKRAYRAEGKHSGVFASHMREWTFDFGAAGALLLSAVVSVGFYAGIKRSMATGFFSLSAAILYNLYGLFLFYSIYYFKFKFVYLGFMIFAMIAFWYLVSRAERKLVRSKL